MKMQLSEIARALGTDEYPELWNDISVTSVQFDSRKLSPGSLFVPIMGERDGHDFISQAVTAGAVATLWAEDHQERRPADLPSILVKNPLEALQKLAKYYLDKINPKVVAITGSNGKTTTKDMTAAVLEAEYNVVKTKANFNNELGVPITILGMSSNTEVLVVEMGMDRPGQLHFLSELVQPDIAVITMIGEAHIEFFKTRERIADAKMEITDGLKEDGCFVFNGDEPLLEQRAKDLNVEQYRFGLKADNDVSASDIQGTDTSTMFKTNLDEETTVTIPVLGDYNVTNALAAIAVGHKYHIDLKKEAEALVDFDLTKNRTEWLTGKKGERILSDVYNSNPTAARAVLDSFANVNTEGRRLVVLGDMLELGENADQMHASLAEKLNAKRFAQVYLIGPHMKALEKRLIDEDIYSKDAVHYYETGELKRLTDGLSTEIQANDSILLKASHGIHLENVVDKIKN
ncbi:UDP-N-acetylmuramoyl-tripeptide--D-alanyl-D-alanine ligase [Pediococcus pentosaceus]|uniref:UDP-N-acetylmuramoyl-tripeptide--D-alanyl-D- alanine ligase n=1 Tax=Pediococcus pentosaceus TaxID=1255 RepID=UPI000CFEA743|nr:UDP-N-acetylmuramoyl-tripeptide--D-alanyl-D-alanine ligase [Pediococcus pentosaceus]AVL02014.1 UDP-N-acetylmuramoyl-tripeptide--D-alanyl-D-alanine ligase [Pediococcus pentosaceus]MBF7134460.1 UDP-N-acetylmuramoyl-tripeptide--D-alanyl-D-alanine ligase [Pediococcus pentosaceus]QPT36142.1 UDP-N-acetylmuramoyl-tripeptide--D-alanyl-D-alanine ligase [Pediococcus pentosaceus]QYY86434.1 UDP-N-acetylmuramoyl-tripeptide--D-alanyl-D-alanine ligase [Pediococcus pentosaceus]